MAGLLLFHKFLLPVVGFLESNENCPADKAGSGKKTVSRSTVVPVLSILKQRLLNVSRMKQRVLSKSRMIASAGTIAAAFL